MTPPLAAPAEYSPLFNWSPARSRRWTLIGFIAASSALHGLCFYLFQITYPPTLALMPPPARLSLIAGNTDEGRLLLRWIEAEDPALSSTTQRPPDRPAATLPSAAHVPSYAGYRPALKDIPPFQPDLRVPSASPPGPVQLPRSPSVNAPGAAATLVRFWQGDVELQPASRPPLQFTASTAEAPQAAQFRVGLGAAGDVRHCILETSSGDPALDEQARRAITLCRFPSREDAPEFRWVDATVVWGNDIAAPNAASVASPAP